jgi:hypothetical protein
VIRKQLDRVEATRAGDYYQAVFEGAGECNGTDYLLLQRQFEFPDGGRCYVETPDVNVCGHFRVRSALLRRNCFTLALANTSWEGFEVHFETDDDSYARLGRILRTMLGRRLRVEK